MSPRMKTIFLAFSMVSVIAAPFAEAARLGKGKSAGMARSTTPSQSYYRPQTTPAPTAPAPAATPQRQGPGVGTAIAAGAAGAAAGYMLGSATSGHNGNQAAPAQQAPAEQLGTGAPAQKESHIPWGLILILGAVLVGGLMWFRRKAGNPALSAPQSHQPFGQGGTPASEPQFGAIPKIGSGTNFGNGFGSTPQGAGAPMPVQHDNRLPDGTEVPYFLRQAKATFLHLQSLNSTESLEEIRKYMTPELFTSLQGDILSNTEVADFPQLDCQLSDMATEGGRYIASVRFNGMVSESVNSAAVPFSETWHYVKDGTTNGKWLVAGIQQN